MVDRILLFMILFFAIAMVADPFPKESQVAKNPKDTEKTVIPFSWPAPMKIAEIWQGAHDIVRVEVEWVETTDSYKFAYAIVEKSGTPALLERTKKRDPLGSYHGMLVDLTTNKPMYFNSLGTGMEYRRLSRAFTFRFPIPSTAMEFRMEAENPRSGKMELVVRKVIDPQQFVRIANTEAALKSGELEVKLLKAATKSPKLFVNVYAEGYLASRRAQFWRDAPKVVDRLQENKFPMLEHMEFRAVFAPSNLALGKAQKLGKPVPLRDSFLGLYYPYWDDFGRWYHVIYPTQESHYRKNIGLVAYDYPIVLVDSSSYWGVGNFKEHTAVPARSGSFTYLLLHEFGHYFGLNEEYEGGGKTELAFAPGISEPWSQNITFLPNKSEVKWKKFVGKNVPIPTPSHYWQGSGPYGAYPGGYAQTPPLGRSYKPGFGCVMHSGRKFCPVCDDAIKERVLFDLGK